MAYVVDVYEPWLGPGHSTYYVEAIAENEGLTVEAWVELLRRATVERGGAIVYEGELEDRPEWLKDEISKEAAAYVSRP